jgi:cell division protein FtsL
MNASAVSERNRSRGNRLTVGDAVRWAHGWTRADGGWRREGFRRRAHAGGVSLLLGLVVIAIATAGIARVRASARVLQLGAEITELTDQQTVLQEQKRRLLAERAYLRHPDQIAETARATFGMVPIVPELVQPIRLVPPPPAE